MHCKFLVGNVLELDQPNFVNVVWLKQTNHPPLYVSTLLMRASIFAPFGVSAPESYYLLYELARYRFQTYSMAYP